MRFFLLLGFLTLNYFQMNAQSIKFDKTTINYGTIKKGANGSKIFNITNTGDKPLIINKVESTCGCTIPKWSKTPILPGKKGKITVKYDTKKIGAIRKSISVFSNATNGKRKVLNITGKVE